MGKSAVRRLAEAVVTILDGDAAVTNNIFNRVPNDYDIATSGGYIILRDFEEEDLNTFERAGRVIFFEVHAVTDYLGDIEALKLLEPVIVALDRTDPSAADFDTGYKLRYRGTDPSAVESSTQQLTSQAARFECFLQESSP